MSSRPSFALAGEAPQHFGVEASLTYIWDVPTLSWVKSTGSGGGGGGAVTVADGADVAEGSRADAAWVSGSGTVIALLKTIASTGASSGLTDAQLRATPVPVSGTVTANAGTGTYATKEVRSVTPTQTSVAGSASSVTVIASNANRLGGTVFNDSTAILFLKLGATASATSYTARLVSNAYFEVPFGYTGIVDGIWASATGNARVTELAA